MSSNYLDKFKGSIFGVAIGDTLGKPFEGMLRDAIHSKFDNFEEFIRENRHIFKTYTDDTQLTLHTAEALIKGRGFDIDILINEYVKWLDDPPIGPGYGCLTSIKKLRYGFSWEDAASNSGGNGTAMRIAPIGLFFCKNIEKLIDTAKKSSQITHRHPAASAGAIVIARAIAYLTDKNPNTGFSTDNFFNSIISAISDSKNVLWNEFISILRKVKANINISLEAGLIKFSQIGVKSPYFIEHYLGKAFVHPYTLSTVACSIFVFLKRLKSFKSCIYELSTAGGDSDTIGAIGGSLAGAYYGFENIPKNLISLVKNHRRIIKTSENLYRVFSERNFSYFK